MRRRGFIAGLGAAAAWPVVARAQQAAMPVIGYLSSASPDNLSDRIRAYFQGLSSTGFEVGRNVLVEYRWARGQYAALPTFATELVQRKVSAIGGSAQALAAKAATSTIPVVFQVGADPTELGLVTSLARAAT